MTRPLLEGIAIDAKTVVACHSLEIGVFPRAASLLDALFNGYGLLFQALRLQGSHPGVDSQACQVRNDAVTRWIHIGAQQFLVVVVNRRRDCQTRLRHEVARLHLYVAVGNSHHVQHHIIVMFVVVVAM